MCVNRQAKIYHKIVETIWKITFNKLFFNLLSDSSLKFVRYKRKTEE